MWKWTIIAGVSTIGWWANLPHVIHTLVILMGLDIATGIVAAAVAGKVSSKSMFQGMLRKIAVFPILYLVHLLEEPLSIPFELESVVTVGYIAYEAMSIIENCATAGVPIPAVIVQALAKAKIKTATADQIKKEFGQESSPTPDGGAVKEIALSSGVSKTEAPPPMQ